MIRAEHEQQGDQSGISVEVEGDSNELLRELDCIIRMITNVARSDTEDDKGYVGYLFQIAGLLLRSEMATERELKRIAKGIRNDGDTELRKGIKYGLRYLEGLRKGNISDEEARKDYEKLRKKRRRLREKGVRLKTDGPELNEDEEEMIRRISYEAGEY